MIYEDKIEINNLIRSTFEIQANREVKNNNVLIDKFDTVAKKTKKKQPKT